MLDVNEAAQRRALETQAALAQRSQHRGATPVDLLVAATAEAYDVVLLHYDKHFDAIGRVTRQPMRWLAPAGSL
jgi:predicted nucleic acid-binding protein